MRKEDVNRIINDSEGGFGFWRDLFVAYVRHQQDPWRSFGFGACWAGSFQMQKGIRVASRSALIGGVLMLAFIEGAGVACGRYDVVSSDDTEIDS